MTKIMYVQWRKPEVTSYNQRCKPNSIWNWMSPPIFILQGQISRNPPWILAGKSG